MKNRIFNIFRILNLLSIDVVAGAMCSSLFLGKLFQVKISIISVLELGLIVWIVYTADHLLDVKQLIKVGLKCSTERHRFHQTYFNQLRIAWIIALLISLTLLLFIPIQVLIAGGLLSTIVIFYLVLNSHLGVLKEFIISSGYVTGVLLPLNISFEQLQVNQTIIIFFLLPFYLMY